MRDKLLLFASVLLALTLMVFAFTLYIVSQGNGSLNTNAILLCSSLYLAWRSFRYVLGRRRKLRALALKQASGAEAVFSSTAATYDPARAKLIPCFAELYGTTVSLLPEGTDQVLDLGAGTGLLSAFVRERFPEAHLHLIDQSEPMLTQARQRFEHDPKAVFTLGDYTACPWRTSYDAVVSALSIHHLGDDRKRTLFARIHTALQPGGVFLNAEQILQPTTELEAEAKADWLVEVRGLGASEEQIADSLLRQTEDRCATVADQLQWMREAGFTQVRCAFLSGRFAVLYGARPEAP